MSNGLHIPRLLSCSPSLDLYHGLTWPGLSYVAEDHKGRIVGYILAKMCVRSLPSLRPSPIPLLYTCCSLPSTIYFAHLKLRPIIYSSTRL